MLWVDKYAPRRLCNLDLHPTLSQRLRKISQSHDFPHLIVTGPCGAGKRTRVSCLIAEIFYPDSTSVPKMQLEHKSIDVTESKTIDIAVLTSPHHTEINLGDLGNHDRAVVVSLIKEMTMNAPLLHANAGTTPGSASTPVPYKIIVLHEVDRISRGAQQALRRTMEKCISTCRLILVAESTGQLIAPLLSRCLEIRVPSPLDTDIVRIMHSVLESEGENVSQLKSTTKDEILAHARGNLRRALLVLEATWRNDGVFQAPQWRATIARIAQMIIQDQTPKQLHEIRGIFYTLLTYCVPTSYIQQHLLEDLLDRIARTPRGANSPDRVQRVCLQLIQLAAEYDHTRSRGSRAIFHLEAFAAEAMSVIKSEM